MQTNLRKLSDDDEKPFSCEPGNRMESRWISLHQVRHLQKFYFRPSGVNWTRTMAFHPVDQEHLKLQATKRFELSLTPRKII